MRKSKRNVTRISKIYKIATGKVKRRTAEGRTGMVMIMSLLCGKVETLMWRREKKNEEIKAWKK
jgi:hypothetical protein